MIEVDGFVLTETPYGETSKIINVLTKEYGVIGIMCKGAKSLKSKLRVPTMKLSLTKFTIKYKEGKLSTLINAEVINPLKNINSDIILKATLMYLSDLTYQVVKQSHEYEKIFNDFLKVILKLEMGLDPVVLTNILEIKYLAFLGVLFNLDGCAICGSKENIVTFNPDSGGYICKNCLTNEVIVDIKVIKMIRMYYYLNIEGLKRIEVEDNIKKIINQFLDMYYERYTGLYLNSKEFLKKLG